jgi:hypothetical protein
MSSTAGMSVIRDINNSDESTRLIQGLRTPERDALRQAGSIGGRTTCLMTAIFSPVLLAIQAIARVMLTAGNLIFAAVGTAFTVLTLGKVDEIKEMTAHCYNGVAKHIYGLVLDTLATVDLCLRGVFGAVIHPAILLLPPEEEQKSPKAVVAEVTAEVEREEAEGIELMSMDESAVSPTPVAVAATVVPSASTLDVPDLDSSVAAAPMTEPGMEEIS